MINHEMAEFFGMLMHNQKLLFTNYIQIWNKELLITMMGMFRSLAQCFRWRDIVALSSTTIAPTKVLSSSVLHSNPWRVLNTCPPPCCATQTCTNSQLLENAETISIICISTYTPTLHRYIKVVNLDNFRLDMIALIFVRSLVCTQDISTT